MTDEEVEELRAQARALLAVARPVEPSNSPGRGPKPCDGADDPKDRCGLHHPTSLANIAGGCDCCCGAPWLATRNQCVAGGKLCQEVTLRQRVYARLAYTVADAPADIDSHTDAVMAVFDAELVGWCQDLNDALNHNDETCEAVKRRDEAEETLAEVRRLCDLTIACSCRAHAIEQAEDTLRILNRQKQAPAPAGDRPPHMAEHGVAYLTDNGTYVIADQGGWVTGSYASEDAARLAVSLDDEQLVELRDRINREAGRGITVADLRAVLDRQADAERAHDLSHVPPKGAADA
ncbi:hypothetical protein [Actinomadura bangladeshensis]|uniref:Uncharacterized protein n=1 Tax=Actinomadura bangladeshensis TaxID=453573 RepID=A0A6L9Q972_9ACTN|nr:hypothetical protein [Actinomadura bangladeshensis]NEA21588.1 hypothetical protein [Actinomadura bangladeshensis]NEA22548.1 hypothetical protein [Actinomadura bangladeshensis]